VSEHVVAAIADVRAGEPLVVRAGGREYGIFRVGERFHALPNACLHQGGPLCRGRLGAALVADGSTGWAPRWEQAGEVIRCPWHQLEFNVTTGRCLADPRRRMTTLEVIVRGSDLVLIV
jgi:3-phenylpropionate/trans-cinnamate dioxygenase ferredoxin subunit